MKWLLFAAAFASAFLLEFPVVLAASAKPQICTPEVIATCEQLANGPIDLAKGQPTIFKGAKPGAIVNTLPFIDSFSGKGIDKATEKTARLSSQLLEFTNPSQNQIESAETLGRTLRDRSVALILGVPVNSTALKEMTTPSKMKTMAPEKRIAIERLQSLNFKVVDGRNPFCRILMAEGIPNAAYDEDRHSIFLCQGMVSQTEAAVASALAHEIGHVISPAGTSLLQYRIKGATPDATREIARSCGENFVYSEQDSYHTEESEYLNLALEVGSKNVLATRNSPLLSSLENCGVLEYVDDSSTTSTDVFKSSRACVEKENAPAYEAALAKYTPLEAEQKKVSAQAARASLMNRMPAWKFGVTSEDFADSFGSKLFGTLVSDMKWTAADIRAALVAYRVSSCQQARPGDRSRDEEAYPSADTRIAHALSQPSVAKALGCEPPTPVCDFKFDATKPVAPISPASTSKPPSNSSRKATSSGGASK